MHHVVALGRPLDRRLGRPADHAPRAALAWGRGLEGQLGVKSFEDSAAPLLMDALKGRHVMQVGGWAAPGGLLSGFAWQPAGGMWRVGEPCCCWRGHRELREHTWAGWQAEHAPA
jgi:hypothetical protein